MSNNPSKVPEYLKYEATSSWHVAALQVIGLESMTITSRLRHLKGRGTLQDLEDTINSTGKRRIAKIEMSVADPDVLSQKDSRDPTSVERSGSVTSPRTSSTDDDLTNFDIDSFTRDYRLNTARRNKREHVFGRAETSRGDWTIHDELEEHDPHDRFNNGPSIQRYVIIVDIMTPKDALSLFSQCVDLEHQINIVQIYCTHTVPAARQLPTKNV